MAKTPTARQRHILERMRDERTLLYTQPGSHHVPAGPAWVGRDEETVNNRTVNALISAGWIDGGELEGSFMSGTWTHQITPKGVEAIASPYQDTKENGQ